MGGLRGRRPRGTRPRCLGAKEEKTRQGDLRTAFGASRPPSGREAALCSRRERPAVNIPYRPHKCRGIMGPALRLDLGHSGFIGQ